MNFTYKNQTFNSFVCQEVCKISFLFSGSMGKGKCQLGEERKYSHYKTHIFVSGLLLSFNSPLLGASTSRTGLLTIEGKIEKEVEEIQSSLYHLHMPACR